MDRKLLYLSWILAFVIVGIIAFSFLAYATTAYEYLYAYGNSLVGGAKCSISGSESEAYGAPDGVLGYNTNQFGKEGCQWNIYTENSTRTGTFVSANITLYNYYVSGYNDDIITFYVYNKTGGAKSQTFAPPPTSPTNLTLDTTGILESYDAIDGVKISWTGVTTTAPADTITIYVDAVVLNVTYESGPSDDEYPIFSNYWDNNASVSMSGTAYFNATIVSTNGTAFVDFNGTNYTASNLSETSFNVSVSISNGGVYPYYWASWGNGTETNYNTSAIKYYTANTTYYYSENLSQAFSTGHSQSSDVLYNADIFSANFTGYFGIDSISSRGYNAVANLFQSFTLSSFTTRLQILLIPIFQLIQFFSSLIITPPSQPFTPITVNNPENQSTVSTNYAILNWTIDIGGGNKEVWVWGSNDTTNLFDYLLYHQYVANGTYFYNYSAMPTVADANTRVLFHFDNRTDLGDNQTLLVDFAGRDNNATLSSPIWNSTNYKFGWAMEFDGTETKRAYIPDSANLDMDAWTISAWIYRKGDGCDGTCAFGGCFSDDIDVVSAKGGGGGDGTGLDANWIIGTSSNIPSFCSENSSGGDYELAGVTTLDDNKWYHLAYTFDGTTVTIYLNGMYESSGNPTAGIYQNNIDVGVGVGLETASNTANGAWNGTIDEFVIFNRSLSAGEIANLYNLSAGTHYWQVNASNSSTEYSSGKYDFTFSAGGVDNPPTVTLVTPENAGTVGTAQVTFNCSATDDSQLVNATLYGNFTGTWSANQTNLVSGTTNSTIFYLNVSSQTYQWNCLYADNSSNVSFASANYTFTVDTTYPLISYSTPTLPNNAETNNDSVIINYSIQTSTPNNFTYNWNGTNYTFYDETLRIWINFENLSSLNECDTWWCNSTDISMYNHIVEWRNDSGNDASGSSIEESGLPKIVSGKYGNAAFFDTLDSNVAGESLLIQHNNDLNPGSEDFAMMLWYKCGYCLDCDISRKGSTNTASTWYKMEIGGYGTANRISLQFNTDNNDATVEADWEACDDEWHFAIGQRNGGTAELWIDAQNITAFTDEADNTIDGSISNTANLSIGSKDTQNDDFFNGTMDEYRIYIGRHFSQEEIDQLYMTELQKYDTDKFYMLINQTKNATGGLDNSTYTYFGCVKSTNGNENCTDTRTITKPITKITDYEYPIFSNYWDDNGTLNGYGTAHFNVSIASTNGTAGIEINNTNYTLNREIWLETDGISDYFSTNNKIYLNNSNTYGEMTISFWYDPNSVSPSSGVVNLFNDLSTSVVGMIYLRHGYGDPNTLFWCIGNGTANNCQTAARVADYSSYIGSSHNLIYTMNSTWVDLYIDGVFYDGNKLSGYGDPEVNFSLGSKISFAKTVFYANASFDEIRLYNRTLTTTEISQIYNSGKVANSSLPSTSLVLWYPLEENNGTVIYDYSGNGNNGTITGATWNATDFYTSISLQNGTYPYYFYAWGNGTETNYNTTLASLRYYTIENILSYSQSLNQGFSLLSVFSRLVSLTQGMFNSLSINSVIERYFSIIRSFFESINLNEGVDKISYLLSSAYNSLSLSSASHRLIEVSYSFYNSLTIVSISTKTIYFIESITEFFNIDDIIAKNSLFFRSVTESFSINNAFNKLISIIQSIFQLLNISGSESDSTYTPSPAIDLTVTSHTEDSQTEANQYDWFYIDVEATCRGNDCGEVNISLDPQPPPEIVSSILDEISFGANYDTAFVDYKDKELRIRISGMTGDTERNVSNIIEFYKWRETDRIKWGANLTVPNQQIADGLTELKYYITSEGIALSDLKQRLRDGIQIKIGEETNGVITTERYITFGFEDLIITPDLEGSEFIGIEKIDDYNALIRINITDVDFTDGQVVVLDPTITIDDVNSYDSTNINVTTNAYPMAHAEMIDDPELYVYWTFDLENKSWNEYDLSGKEMHGERIGQIGLVEGVYGNAMHNDLSVNRSGIRTPNSTSEFSNPSASYSFWATRDTYPEGTTGAYMYLIGVRYTGGTAGRIMQSRLVKSGNGWYIAWYNNSGGSISLTQSGGDPDIGEWVHYVITRNCSTSACVAGDTLNVTGYRNGVAVLSYEGTDGWQRALTAQGGFILGSYSSSSDLFGLNGSIDDFMFFNRTLSSSEVSAIYNNQSERFEQPATQTFFTNFTAGDNRVNVTYNTTLNQNTAMQLRINEYIDDSLESSTDWQALSNGDNELNVFNISEATNNVSLEFNYTTDSYKFYTPTLRDNIVVTTWNEGEEEPSGTKDGLVSTTSGDTPFWTNSSNPWNVTLNKDETKTLRFWVNATGDLGTNHTFFAYANLTSDESINNETFSFNISITTDAVFSYTRNVANLLSLESLVDRILDGTVKISQLFSIDSVLKKYAGILKALSQAFSIHSLEDEVLSLIRGIVSSLSINSSSSKILSSIRAISQPIVVGVSLVINTVIKTTVLITDFFDITDLIDTDGYLSRIASNGLTVQGIVKTTALFGERISQAFSLQEIQSNIIYLIRSFAEILNLNVLSDETGFFGKLISQEIVVSDSHSYDSQVFRAFSNSFSIEGITQRTGYLFKNILQLLQISSSSDEFVFFGRIISDDLQVEGSTSTIFGTFTNIENLLSISDIFSRWISVSTKINQNIILTTLMEFEIAGQNFVNILQGIILTPLTNLMQVLGRGVSENIGIDGSLDSYKLVSKEVANEFMLGDSFNRLIFLIRNPVQTILIYAETATTRVGSNFADIFQNLIVTPLADPTAFLKRGFSNGMNVFDEFNLISGFKKAIFQAWSIDESILRNFYGSRGYSGAISAFSEAETSSWLSTKHLLNEISLGTGFKSLLGAIRTTDENLVFGGFGAHLGAFGTDIVQEFQAGSAVTRLFVLTRAFADQLSLYDSAIGELTFNKFTRNLANSLSLGSFEDRLQVLTIQLFQPMQFFRALLSPAPSAPGVPGVGGGGVDEDVEEIVPDIGVIHNVEKVLNEKINLIFKVSLISGGILLILILGLVSDLSRKFRRSANS